MKTFHKTNRRNATAMALVQIALYVFFVAAILTLCSCTNHHLPKRSAYAN
jgi:hypothetical protein